MKRTKILPALALAVLIGALSITSVRAIGETNSTSLVQKIAKRFGLNESEVQAVFDEERESHRKEMEQRIADKLNQAVKDGKITQAQKDMILKKHEELRTKHEGKINDFAQKSPEDRKVAFEKERQELEAWAKENNIDLSYFFLGGKGHFMKMRGN